MAQKTTAHAVSSRAMWERLDEFVREPVQRCLYM